MWHYFWQVSTHSESSCKSSKERRPIVRCIPGPVEQRRSLVGPACRTAGSFQGHLRLTTSLKLGAPPSFSGRPFHARELFFQPSSLARARCPLPRFVDIGRIFCHRQKGVFTPNLASLFPFITGIICWDPILRRAAYSQISFNGAPTGFPFTSPTASQSRNFPQRTLFPSHSTWFTSSCIAQHYQPQAPQSHCSTSAAPTLCVSLFWAPNPFFGGRLPLWCDLCTHWPGLGSCREEAGPTVGPLSAAAAERTTGWGRKPDFPLPWATTYIDCPLSGEVRNHPKGFLEAHDLSLFISFPFERISTEIHALCMYCHWQYRSVSGLE